MPGYDFSRQMASRGEISVVIDGLGYAPSDRPPGFGVCVGSQADIVHQIVTELRSGRYIATAAPGSRSAS